MDKFSRRKKIVVVGSYGVGMSVTLDVAPQAGETVVGHSFTSGHGGKGSNQAVAAARLGAQVMLCSVVGSDVFGTQARSLWVDEGVDASMVRTLDGSTMLGVILVERSGENRIAIVPGVLDQFAPDHLDTCVDALADADVLVVGLEIPLRTAHRALQLGRRAGIPTILNPAPAPPAGLPQGMLELVDHIIPNRTEAEMIAGVSAGTDPSSLARSAAFAGVGTVVLTLGAAGAMVYDDGRLTSVEAPSVPVVDTTGAGDAFTGAYASALADGATPIESARFATRAAALSVTKRDVIPSLPRLADIGADG